MLQLKGCKVWRTNNLAVPGRKFIGMKGQPDIIGYHTLNGRAVWCEVKTVNDKVSEAQEWFMEQATDADCLTYVATQLKSGNIVLLSWREYLKTKKGDKA